MKRTLISLFILTFILFGNYGCKKDNLALPDKKELLPSSGSNNLETNENNEDLMVLGPQLQNPYTVANMTIALSNLIASEGLGCSSSLFNVRTTHKYVKFMPQNEAQLQILFDDTTLVLFDYPLDREVIVPGVYYRDSSITDTLVPTFQYACVPVNYVFPNEVNYSVLATLYLPEGDELLNTAIQNDSSIDACRDALVDEALLITNNSLEYSAKTNNTTTDKFKTNIFGSRSSWFPSGAIVVFDNRKNQYMPVEGVKVRVRRWFEIREALTSISGYFFIPHKFKRDVNYSIKWERNDFDIRSGFLGQAYFNGPKQSIPWNLWILSGKSRHYATAHIAAIHYFYYCQGFYLTPPLGNTFLSPRLKIAVHTAEEPWYMDGIAATHPGTRVFGAFPVIDLYGGSRRSDFIYGTTIHELAHYAHWGFDPYNYNNDTHSRLRIAESWADGVEWVFAKWRYGSYGDPGDPNFHTGGTNNYQDRTVGDDDVYTSIVVDMIDNQNQQVIPSEHSTYYYLYPIDEVNGYQIHEIEQSLRGVTYWNEWRNNLINNYNNATENNLYALFASWN